MTTWWSGHGRRELLVLALVIAVVLAWWQRDYLRLVAHECRVMYDSFGYFWNVGPPSSNGEI